MKGSRYVIIGNGVAGNSAAAVIRKLNRSAEIIMISQDPLPEYSACAFKKYISGEIRRKQVLLKTINDYSKENIRTFFGQKVYEIDIEKMRILLKSGSVSYDKLIVATGSTPITLPIEGIEKKGIFTLKTLKDADKIVNFTGRKVVILGPSYIGIETSIALKKRGWEVFLVGGRMGRILRSTFDEKPSLILRKIIEDNGIKVITGERPTRFNGDTHVRSVITDRQEIECDMVVLVLGMRPEVELAKKAGIEIGKFGGIKVNKQMMTNVEGVYACGDCIESNDIITGETTLSLLWHNAKQQGEIAGYNSVGIRKGYHGVMNIYSINILGTHGVSIGHTVDEFKDTNLEIIESGNNHNYYRLLIVNGIFIGAQFVGKIKDIGSILSAILRGDSLERLRRILDNENLLYKNPWLYRVYPYMRGIL